ncbi:molybdenum cofactor guanylyltransferase [Alkalibacter mobilis]|uniref:molybdenum cofactor guanylyltransferase n=1 Tax=Alkalibacter mobilis TaxID=2787712 RepID=UPI00189D3FA7|nr:molybdenum cofactor guanylyltransferase [Alkalibacter mobilis]MBF7096666.1 molybdenum cofactor guanylyltransferase [Alkalibacter mobilis]
MREFGTAIVLAGGKSSRMGFDKQKLIIHNCRLMNRITETLEKSFEEIVLVTQTPEDYEGLSLKTVKDKIAGMGPLGGIHAGLLESTSKFSYVFACDMPVIDMSYVDFMKEKLAGSDYEGCVTRYKDWIEPFNAFYSKELINGIEDYLKEGRKSIFKFLERRNIFYIPESEAREFSPDWDMFYNLNTKEDINGFVNKAKESC